MCVCVCVCVCVRELVCVCVCVCVYACVRNQVIADGADFSFPNAVQRRMKSCGYQ